jgi:cytidine deaminase
MDREGLLQRAAEARERAHAPYSGFRVGAALLTEAGTVFVGCNVENASYGLTLCAERVAVSAAVAAGETRFEAVAVVTEPRDGGPVAPCGACRQVLSEFAPSITVVSQAGDRIEEWTLDRLLPAPFRRIRSGASEQMDGAQGAPKMRGTS